MVLPSDINLTPEFLDPSAVPRQAVQCQDRTEYFLKRPVPPPVQQNNLTRKTSAIAPVTASREASPAPSPRISRAPDVPSPRGSFSLPKQPHTKPQCRIAHAHPPARHPSAAVSHVHSMANNFVRRSKQEQKSIVESKFERKMEARRPTYRFPVPMVEVAGCHKQQDPESNPLPLKPSQRTLPTENVLVQAGFTDSDAGKSCKDAGFHAKDSSVMQSMVHDRPATPYVVPVERLRNNQMKKFIPNPNGEIAKQPTLWLLKNGVKMWIY